jgi:hypothetical protein
MPQRAELPQREPGLAEPHDEPADRWPLIRDAVVLQLKVVLEGLKDLILGPVALAATLLDLAVGERPGRSRAFYRVLRAGKRFERWLNLYGALPAEEDLEERGLVPGDADGIDAYFGRIERTLAQEHARGRGTASVKRRVDAWLDRIESLTRK